MSCSLTYDSTLSRVRVEADSLCVTGVVDTFTRDVTGGWGNATSGQPWTTSGGSASDYSVSVGWGLHNNVTENVFRMTTIDYGQPDVDVTVEVGSDKIAAGNSQAIEVGGRWTSDQNHYALRLTTAITTQEMTLDVRKRVAGATTVIAGPVTTGMTHVATVFDWVRLRVVGSLIQAKAWNGTVEPDDWLIEVIDTSLVAGNLIALRTVLFSSTSNEPVLFGWDNLTTTVADHAIVDRTTNGVNYTTVRGAGDVGVTTGCELERVVDDFEFPVGQEIIYRVRSYDSEDRVLTTSECTITVDLEDVWIKSISRPFLNQRVNCVLNPYPIVRNARNGIFDVVGRSYPIGVTDVRGSRQVPVQVVTSTTEERKDMDLLLASGDPVFYHTPVDHPLPTMYAVIEDTAEARPLRNRRCGKDWRLFNLPSIEVAAPSSDVVGSLGTWQTVVNTYATWTDVLTAHPTWASLLELVGTGEEVIVP